MWSGDGARAPLIDRDVVPKSPASLGPVRGRPGRQYGLIARRRILVQLDDARLAALDERAAASGRSRSDLVREAIDLLLQTGDAGVIDAAIVAGYARVPAPERDPWALEGALAAIKAEPW
jgi:Arc/MetJ-type ribon-helix-helix transcriptional regulator